MDAHTRLLGIFGFLLVLAAAYVVIISPTQNYSSAALAAGLSVRSTSTNASICSDATTAQFNSPFGVASLSNGDVVIADTQNNRIRKYTSNGALITVSGSSQGYLDGPTSRALYNSPYDVSTASDGTIFVADTYNNMIRKISPSGVVSTIAGGNQGGGTPCPGINNSACKDGVGMAAQFNNPTGISYYEPRNMLFVADSANQRVRVIDIATSTVTTIAGSGAWGYANGPGLSATFQGPFDVHYGPTITPSSSDDFLFVTDNHSVRLIDFSPSTGLYTVSTFAGGPYGGYVDGYGPNVRFNAPRGITRKGNIVYVADAGNNRIRSVAGGTVQTFSGEAVNSQGQPISGSADSPNPVSYYTPIGITATPTGEFFIGDSGNHSLRRISTNNYVTRMAGNLTAGFSNCSNGKIKSSCVSLSQCEKQPGQGSLVCQQNTDCHCGNNIIDAGEVCDPPGGNYVCQTSGGYAGAQACNGTCSGYSACTSSQYCGDGMCNGPETQTTCLNDCMNPNPAVGYTADAAGGIVQNKAALCTNASCTNATIKTILNTNYSSSAGYAALSGARAANGFPQFAIYHAPDFTSTGISIATCHDTACSSPTIQLVTPTGSFSTSHSFAIGSDGLPILLYVNYPPGLAFAHCSTPDCSGTTNTAAIDANGGSGSVVVGSDGNPVLTAIGNGGYAVNFYQCQNVTCTQKIPRTIVSSSTTFFSGTGVALGSDGFPILSYYYLDNNGTGGVKFVKCNDVSCNSTSTKTVETGSTNQYFEKTAVIQVGTDGFPVMAYYLYDFTGGPVLRFFKCNDLACNTGNNYTLANPSQPYARVRMDMIIGPNGLPLVVYHDTGVTNNLQMIACTTSSCSASNAFTVDNYISPSFAPSTVSLVK